MKKNKSLPILSVKTEKRRVGTFGERVAKRYLLFRGYRFLAHNYVARGHEIDLIARRKNTIHFIEVKTRDVNRPNRSELRPASSVTPEKQRAILSAANYYMISHKSTIPEGTRFCFDIIEVIYEKKTRFGKEHLSTRSVKHLISCFDRNSAYS